LKLYITEHAQFKVTVQEGKMSRVWVAHACNPSYLGG
jgi:hypothetical protein